MPRQKMHIVSREFLLGAPQPRAVSTLFFFSMVIIVSSRLIMDDGLRRERIRLRSQVTVSAMAAV